MAITFDDLPEAKSKVSFDDLPDAAHGIKFDDLPDAPVAPSDVATQALDTTRTVLNAAAGPGSIAHATDLLREEPPLIEKELPYPNMRIGVPQEIMAPDSGILESAAGQGAKGALETASGVQRFIANSEPTSAEFSATMDRIVSGTQEQYDNLQKSIAERGYSTAEEDQTLRTIANQKAIYEGQKKGGLSNIYHPERDASKLQRRADANALASEIGKAADEAFQFYGANPASENPVAQIGRGLGSAANLVASMPAGIPGMAIQAGAQAWGTAYNATEKQLRTQGVTDEQSIQEQSTAAAQSAALKTAPGLAAYMLGGKLSGEIISKLIPEAASPLIKGVAGALGESAGLTATGATLRALEGQDWKPTVESMTMDAIFGVLGGYKKYEGASAEVKQRAAAELVARVDKGERTDTLMNPEVKSQAIEGLVITRDALLRGIESQTPEVRRARVSELKNTASQLDAFPKEEVAAAEARIAQRGESTPPKAEAAPEVPAGGPQPEVTRTPEDFTAALKIGNDVVTGKEGESHRDIFDRYVAEHRNDEQKFAAAADALADDSAHVFQDKTENIFDREQTSKALGVEKPMQSDVLNKLKREAKAAAKAAATKIDPEIAQVYMDKANQIADEVAGSSPSAARDKAYNAALDNATGSLGSGKQPTIKFMRASAQSAWKEVVEKQAESLDAPIGDGEISRIEQQAAPEPTRVFDSEAQSVLDRADLTAPERTIVDAVKGGKYDSIDQAAEALGIPKSTAHRSFSLALEKLQSMGPGAASAYETLARYELRKFGERLGADKEIAPEIRGNVENRYYEVLPNRVTAEEAATIIEKLGVDESISLVKDLTNDTTPAVRSTIGQIVIKKLNEQFQALQERSPTEARRVLDKAVDLAEWQMEYGTKLGQGVQSFAMWSRLTPEGKLRTFVRAVDKARTTFEKTTGGAVGKIRQAAKSIPKELTKEQKIEALRKKILKDKTAKKLKRSTLEKIVELADADLLKEENVWQAVSKDLGLPNYSPEVAAEIMKLAQVAYKAAEGIPRNEATAKLMNFMAKQRGFSAGDLPLGIYYGNILSGYNTHIVNALDTGLNVLSELGSMALDNPKEASAIVRGAIRGLGEGKSDAILALSEGRRITEGKISETPGIMEAAKFGEKGGVPISVKGPVSRAMQAVAESKLGYPLNAYKYVGRLMAASDTIFYRSAQEARAALLAYREAAATGAEKVQLRAEADRILGYDRIDEFRQQAKAEGFTGAKADARSTELMMQARPEKLREDSGDFAGLATYNHAPEGLLGYFSDQVSKMTTKLPVLKLIVPFTRIVANVTNRGLDYTPYGYKRALAGRTFGEGPLLGEKRTAMLTKATAGTIGLASLGIMNQLGILQVHGGGPSDREKKRQLQASGWKPYSIQIGDTYFSYLPTPMGLGLSALGNYIDSDRYKELKQKDAATRLMYSVSRISSTVFNQSFLSGLSGIFQAMSSDSPGQQISKMKQLFSRTASSLTIPNLAKDVNRIFDPSYRDSNSIAEDLVRDIPVVRLALSPSLNAYGKPLNPPSNRFVSTRKSDPAWRIVADKNLRIPVADETVFTDPRAGYEYQKSAGQEMKRYIERILPKLKTMTNDQAQESITNASHEIFSRVRGRVRSQYPNSLRQRKSTR